MDAYFFYGLREWGGLEGINGPYDWMGEVEGWPVGLRG